LGVRARGHQNYNGEVYKALCVMPLLLLVTCGRKPGPELKPSVDAQTKIHVGDFLASAENCGVIHSARPAYPKAAKKARIEGVVTVEFTITKSGDVRDVHALSGDPVFVPAAIAAAREYRFAPCRIPTLPDSEPLEYRSQLQFSFNLNQ
jgi:TonB family protein